jgi:dolichol-phosphate mannosyltransferase
MPASPELSVVIPTYNERDRIETLVRQIFDACGARSITAEIIVVDDNSPDGTGAIADGLAASLPVRVIHRAGKLGLGSAVLDGFRAAGSSVVGVMDADLSHPAQLVPTLYETLRSRNLDIVVGSRYVDGGGTRDWPASRQLLSRMGCLATRMLTPVRDAMSGFFLIRRELALGVPTSLKGFKIGLELLVKSDATSVAEVGYVFVDRKAGGSKMGARETVRFAWQLIDLYGFALRGARRWPQHQVVTLATRG